MSDTPITDKLTAGCYFGPFVEGLASHARVMERDNAMLRRQVEVLRDELFRLRDVVGETDIELINYVLTETNSENEARKGGEGCSNT
ncbi:MAG: hypothetical protein K9N51_02405 [Candidatus Pacebacteria bacterium]|nr:hypothetical protein [Candidatus Paceibacterota bacterium]